MTELCKGLLRGKRPSLGPHPWMGDGSWGRNPAFAGMTGWGQVWGRSLAARDDMGEWRERRKSRQVLNEYRYLTPVLGGPNIVDCEKCN